MIQKKPTAKTQIRCATYVRKSNEEGLDSGFSSLDAQREACEAYIQSRKHEGWVALPDVYSDGGYTGANIERPGLQRLLADLLAGKLDVIICYKLDRLSRSLLDFAKLMELFEEHEVSFVSITQSFDSRTPMGRLVLHILLSFSEFEREIIGERIRDKVAASKRRGQFMGGTPPLGYDVKCDESKLIINPVEAETVRHIFGRFTEIGSALRVAGELNMKGITTKSWMTKKGVFREGRAWDKSHIYRMLHNRTYIGEVVHKGSVYPGEHEAIIDRGLWDKAHAVIEKGNKERTEHPRSESPALLRGIIRCGHCDRSMSPVSTRSNGKIYRYYCCGKASKSGYDACPVKSVAAGEVEQAVTHQIRTVFRRPGAFLESLPSYEREETSALTRLDEVWDDLFPLEQCRIVKLLLKSVTVGIDGMRIELYPKGIHTIVLEMNTKGDIEA